MKNCRRSRVDIITPILYYSRTPFSHHIMSRLAEIVAHKRQEIAPWLNHTEDWEERAQGHRPDAVQPVHLIEDRAALQGIAVPIW